MERKHPRLKKYDYGEVGAYFITFCTKNRETSLSKILSVGRVTSPRPTTHTIIRGIKSLATRRCGRALWQASYYDHIIRDEHDFALRYEYIEQNPTRWEEDEYYA